MLKLFKSSDAGPVEKVMDTDTDWQDFINSL